MNDGGALFGAGRIRWKGQGNDKGSEEKSGSDCDGKRKAVHVWKRPAFASAGIQCLHHVIVTATLAPRVGSRAQSDRERRVLLLCELPSASCSGALAGPRLSRS